MSILAAQDVRMSTAEQISPPTKGYTRVRLLRFDEQPKSHDLAQEELRVRIVF